MNISTSSHFLEAQEWQDRLANSRTHILAQARAGRIDKTELRQVADMEARLMPTLYPAPKDVAAHIRSAHAYARPYLERLLTHDPTLEVIGSDADRGYTPRKVLRRVLDHALDHLNQLEQWLLWQSRGVVPTPTDGWADSVTTLEEDHLPLTSPDLQAWLWRIDLAIALLAERASQLGPQQLDWTPPADDWSLRHMLHHQASAEIYYVIWLDAALPEEVVARYAETSQRLSEQLDQAWAVAKNEDIYFFDGTTAVTLEDVIEQALTAERSLLHE